MGEQGQTDGWPISKNTATVVALVFFLVVFLAGTLCVLLFDNPSFGPLQTTTTVKVEKGPGAGRSVTRIELHHEPAAPAGERSPGPAGRTVRRTTERPEGTAPAGEEGGSAPAKENGAGASASLARRKTLTEGHQRSFLESLVGEVGLYALQWAAVFMAAFVGAALLRRVLVGDFDFKLGGLDLSEKVEKANENVDIELSNFTAKVAQSTVDIGESLTVLAGRVDQLERQPPAAGPEPEPESEPEPIPSPELPDVTDFVVRMAESLAVRRASSSAPLEKPAYFEDKISPQAPPSGAEEGDLESAEVGPPEVDQPEAGEDGEGSSPPEDRQQSTEDEQSSGDESAGSA